MNLHLKKISFAFLLTGAVLVSGSLPGCSGCQGGKAPLAFAPADALGVLVLPGVGPALTQAKAFLDRFKDNPMVSKGVKQGKAELVRELGFDPEKPEELKKIGLDPGAGLVAHLAADGETAAVAVGVDDEAVLEKYIASQVAKQGGGAVEIKPKEVDGVKLKEIVLKGGNHSTGAYAVVKKTLVVCIEAKDGKHGAYVAKLAKLDKDIGDNKAFAKLSKQVGKHQLVVYVDGQTAEKAYKAHTEERLKSASKFMKKYIKEKQQTESALFEYFRGAAFGFHISGKGATVRAYLAVPDDKAKKLADLFKGKGDAPEFGRYIGPDALMVSRFSLDAQALMDKVVETLSAREKRGLYREMDQIEKQAKIDVRMVIKELLAGRYAAAIFPPKIDPKVNLSSLMRRPAAAASMISAVLFAQVTDSDKVKELLANLERMMVMERMDVRIQTGKDELKRYYLEMGGKKVVGWTVKDKLVVVAVGDRLDKTLALMDKGGDNVLDQIESSRAKGLFKRDEGIVAYYNLAKTGDMVRGLDLPAEFKLMMTPVLTTINKFADLTGSMEIKDAGLLGELNLRLADQ